MSELDPEALFHRSLNGRTDWTGKLPYDLDELPERYSDAFRRAGAQTAYIFRKGGLSPILFKLKKGQDFAKYATRWENVHSKLIHGHGAGKVFPVLNNDMTIIGHLGTFSNFEIYTKIGGKDDLDALIAQGNVLVEKDAASHANFDDNTAKERFDLSVRNQRDKELQRQGYMYNQAARPETHYTVITDPDGCVLLVTGVETRGAIEPSSVSILDLVAIPRLVFLIGQGIAKRIILCAVRKLVARRIARGAAQELSGAVAAPIIAKQAKKITPGDMLAWEKEGGHTLQRHNPMLSRQQLKSRIIGKEEVPAPQLAKGGVKGADMRVWQGEREGAASRWASEETMHETIGDVINKNLDMIRSVTKRGGKVALERVKVGYQTGSGWITTTGKAGTSTVKAGESAMFYGEKLTGVTIYIEPTTTNAEGWFVRTAFPELVE
jgi:hypothetical protein